MRASLEGHTHAVLQTERVNADAAKLQTVEKLSRERPLGNIFNFYVLLSVLLQFAVHIVALVYVTGLSKALEE